MDTLGAFEGGAEVVGDTDTVGTYEGTALGDMDKLGGVLGNMDTLGSSEGAAEVVGDMDTLGSFEGAAEVVGDAVGAADGVELGALLDCGFNLRSFIILSGCFGNASTSTSSQK